MYWKRGPTNKALDSRKDPDAKPYQLKDTHDNDNEKTHKSIALHVHIW